ncbi:tetratricopeptide repeat-containing sulfotransferase family protein [Pararobbsia alpina]|uniref:Beta-barrel assembly-enhancing protease n=1 Tax=Pararobbsia alpina TaxID=621374 RepID=A0A6S7BL41_9BURK|nr:tetratricopeptide repeat-containing sulfotransferase family protein [Pararobbsia alpina]CAB3802706.1 Beta-barrel assembly-enhancing protease [Pararobbsia alpina]
MSTTSGPSTLSVAEALNRAQGHWNAREVPQAERLCQRILAASPGQPDALHLLGLMAHAHGNLDLAIALLSQACMATQAPAIYSSNLAEMYRRKGLLAQGEQAARRAVALEPTLIMGWNNLGILLQEAGKFDESSACLERVIALNPEWAEAHNNLANTYRRLARLDLCETYYRRAVELNPRYAEAYSNLAFLLSTQGRYDEAQAAAQRAIELSPHLIDAYVNLADLEMSRHRYDAALQALDALRAFAPHHPAALVAYSKVLRQIEHHDEALDFAREAVALAPRSAEAYNTLANAYQSLGFTDEAMAAFEQAAQLPGTVTEEALVGRAILLLEAGRKAQALATFDQALEAFPGSVQTLTRRADARTFEVDDPDIAMLEAFIAEGERRALPDRTAAHFALGKAYLDIKEPARAFAHFEAGNRQHRASFAYDCAASGRSMKRIAEHFPAGLFDRLKRQGEASEMPVFIVGMPRSGTTLIEQIVSSHPQVTGAGELSALRRIVEASGLFPDGVSHMSGEDLARLGRDYLAKIAPLSQGRARVVDKMPGNFLHAGLIALILPGARIIHARRNAIDTCLSCYTKLFGGEQPFAYSQTELGEYYRYYEELMAHWRAVLPAHRFIEIDYETVVDNLEHEARRLVDFLGLPWNDACLRFHENRRVVRTTSVNQVRRPIYQSSKGRWQAYSGHLGPLLASLGLEP